MTYEKRELIRLLPTSSQQMLLGYAEFLKFKTQQFLLNRLSFELSHIFKIMESWAFCNSENKNFQSLREFTLKFTNVHIV